MSAVFVAKRLQAWEKHSAVMAGDTTLFVSADGYTVHLGAVGACVSIAVRLNANEVCALAAELAAAALTFEQVAA